MQNSKYILLVIERDADGCGADIEMYVQFDHVLTVNEKQLFEECLAEAKAQKEDTSEKAVLNALEMLKEKTDVLGELINVPYDDYVDF